MYGVLPVTSSILLLALFCCHHGSCDEPGSAIPKLNEASSAEDLNRLYKSLSALFGEIIEHEEATAIETFRATADKLRNCNFNDPKAVAFLAKSQLREQVGRMLLDIDTLAVIRNVEPASLARLAGRQLRDYELPLARSLVA